MLRNDWLEENDLLYVKIVIHLDSKNGELYIMAKLVKSINLWYKIYTLLCT